MILDILSKHKPALLDSTRQSFNYDNAGMDLAVLIAEKVLGKNFQQVLSEYYFLPLKMNSTFIRPPYLSQINRERAVGYRWSHDSLLKYDIVDREGFYGGGNLHFTTMDLYKWGQSFYRDSIHKTIMNAFNEPVKIGGKTSGLNSINWYYTPNKPAFYYWGNVYGFYSHLYHDDERKFTIAFMTNTTFPYSMRQPLASSLKEIMETGKYSKHHFQLPAYI